MADPLGTIGIAPRVQSDMDIALGAGPDFLARLKQLGDARDAAAKAQAELRLGEAAKSALDTKNSAKTKSMNRVKQTTCFTIKSKIAFIARWGSGEKDRLL